MNEFQKQVSDVHRFLGWAACFLSGLLAILLTLTRQNSWVTVGMLIGLAIVVCPRTPLPTSLKMLIAFLVYLLL